MTFTRMDRGTIEEWTTIGQAVDQWQADMPTRVRAMLLSLQERKDGLEINQLQHGLQTATRALRDHASEEMIVAALCHDIATAISVENHAAISAEILKPYVSRDIYEIVRAHQDFQGRYYSALTGKDPDARRQYEDEPWYEMACRFSDEWDQASFDPDYDMLPLEYFAPMIDRVFKQPRQHAWMRYRTSVGRRWARMKRWAGQRKYFR